MNKRSIFDCLKRCVKHPSPAAVRLLRCTNGSRFWFGTADGSGPQTIQPPDLRRRRQLAYAGKW